jgi:hypothetical protein
MKTLAHLLTIFSLSYHAAAQFGPGGLFSQDALSWSGWGGGSTNRRFAEWNINMNSSNLHTITKNCQLSYPNGVSATPTVRTITPIQFWNANN